MCGENTKAYQPDPQKILFAFPKGLADVYPHGIDMKLIYKAELYCNSRFISNCLKKYSSVNSGQAKHFCIGIDNLGQFNLFLPQHVVLSNNSK